MDPGDALATLVGFAVAACILVGLAVFVGADAVLAALGRARLLLVALVAAAIVGWLCLWGVSLRVVLGAVGTEISTADAVLVHASAAFANHVTPFGQAGGEPVAAWLLSDVTDSPFERSLAAVAGFDAINVVPSLALALLGLATYGAVRVVGEELRTVAAGVSALALGLSLLALLAWRRRREVEAAVVRIAAPLAGVLSRFVPRIEPTAAGVEARIERFVGDVERIAGDRRRVTVAIGLSAAGWGVQMAGLWIALGALGATVPLYVPLFVVPLGTMAGALPTPGGLGGVETLQIGLLALATTVPEATIAGAVAIFSVGGFFLTTSLGAAAMATLQVRGRDIERP